MKDDTLIDFNSPASTPADALTALIHNGAKQLIQQAVEAELAEYMQHFSDNKLNNGRAAVVRNGYHPERNIQTGIGDVPVKIPKVRSKDSDISACFHH